MDQTLMTGAFWLPTAIGLLGVAGWFAKAFGDPNDDRFTSIFRDLIAHGRSVVVALIGYLVACIGAYEAQQLTIVAAIGLGFMAQSGSSAFTPTAKPAKVDPKP